MKQAHKPKFKRYIFAENAKATNIEDVPDTQFTDKEIQGYIGYQHGYTEYNMKPLTEGGKPPRGQQLNQVLKDITSVTQYATVGGTYGIDSNVINSTGYPKNAIICVDDVGLFRSLRDDNKESDYKNTSSWKKVVDFNPKFYQQRILGEVFFANRLDNPDGCLKCNGTEYRIYDYPRLQKYMENGKVKYTSYDDYQSMIDNTGSCILFAWDKGETFKVPTLKCGAMLSNAYGQIKRYIAVDNYTPEFGRSLKDQIFDIRGYVGPLYSDVPLGYKVKLYDFVGNGVFALTEENDTLNSGGYWHGLQGSRVRNPNKIVKIVFDTSQVCATGSEILPRTVHLNAFVVVNDYFTTTLNFIRDDSNDPVKPSDGVWEIEEQYDFTGKNELEFTYDNNERYKLFLSNLRTDANNQTTTLIANVSTNGDTYINSNNYNMNQFKIGYDSYTYTLSKRNAPYIFIHYVNSDSYSVIEHDSVANLEVDIMKGFSNNKKQFIANLYVSNHNNRDTIQTKIETIATVVSDSFDNAGKIKIKAQTSSARLSGNVCLYKIN